MSVWGTAIWGTDRWPALSISEMLQSAPNVTHGVPTGVGDWRVSVQVLLPADLLATWGIATWGTSEWPTYVWHDLTYWCRGVEWTRGSDEPYGRPRVGQLSMTLDSRFDEFSPWSKPSNVLTDEDGDALLDESGDPLVSEGVASPGYASPSWWAPGTIIRVGLRSATDSRAGGWLPQFCGVVDSWLPKYATANLADKYVDVTALETLRDLAQVDDNALPSAVGSGETAQARFSRLLDAAGWKYGLLVEAQNVLFAGGNTVQSTDMAANRLAECYQVADAADAQFRTDRTGAALVTNVEYIGTVGVADTDVLPLMDFSVSGGIVPAIGFSRSFGEISSILYLEYRPDSFESSTTDENVINDCRFARVGGTQQVSEQKASIARYGRRTLVRNDFINTSDGAVATIADYTGDRRALNSLRVENVTVDIDRQPEAHALAAWAADIQSYASVYPPSVPLDDPAPAAILGFVRALTHRVTPRNTGEVTWEASYKIDTRTVFGVPGAQLPTTT